MMVYQCIYQGVSAILSVRVCTSHIRRFSSPVSIAASCASYHMIDTHYYHMYTIVIVERFLSMTRGLFDEKEMKKGLVTTLFLFASSFLHASLVLYTIMFVIWYVGSMVSRTSIVFLASSKDCTTHASVCLLSPHS